jgi:hypothetical protein
MNTTIVAIIVVVAVLVIAIALVVYFQKRKTERLRSRFGPEYDRIADSEGNRRQAERVLSEREKRVSRLDIVPLSTAERDRFSKAWQIEQARFVDDPRSAVTNADQLVNEVMGARGYPMGDFEQRAGDVSVDHASVIDNYRIAHDIALRNRNGAASTEELRKALLHYRMLFEDLLEERTQTAEVRR